MFPSDYGLSLCNTIYPFVMQRWNINIKIPIYLAWHKKSKVVLSPVEIIHHHSYICNTARDDEQHLTQ
jgi:hypothetical protein